MQPIADGFTTAAAAFRRFTEVMELVIDEEASRLVPAGRARVHVDWAEDRFGWTNLAITLDDGSVVRGRGQGKLDALAAAERSLVVGQAIG